MENTKESIINFLRDKNILMPHATKWRVEFEDGRTIDLVDLIYEYVNLNSNEKETVKQYLDYMASRFNEILERVNQLQDEVNELKDKNVS